MKTLSRIGISRRLRWAGGRRSFWDCWRSNLRQALAWLEELLHPLVSLEYLQWRERLGELPNPPRVCVTEVPLLYETGGDARFDKVVVITAPTKLRRARSIVATEDRESRLLPDREKVERADFAFKNTGSLEELDEFVASVMHELVS